MASEVNKLRGWVGLFEGGDLREFFFSINVVDCNMCNEKRD